MRKVARHLPLLIDLTKREFKIRYLGSLLGSYWNLLHPLMMIFIYTIIFSHVMHSRLGGEAGNYSYSLYLCSGLLAWNFFSEIVNRGTVTLLDNASFLKKMAFPPVILFGAMYASAGINFLISLSIFLVALQFISPVGPVLFSVFLVTVVMYGLFGLGLAISLGCLNVFLRDFQQVTSIIFQLWFWFTPIVYLVEALPDFARQALYFNPSYPFMKAFHDLLYYKRFPGPHAWLAMVGWITISLLFAAFIYRKSISLVRDQL